VVARYIEVEKFGTGTPDGSDNGDELIDVNFPFEYT
jgi:hypothetical protein